MSLNFSYSVMHWDIIMCLVSNEIRENTLDNEAYCLIKNCVASKISHWQTGFPFFWDTRYNVSLQVQFFLCHSGVFWDTTLSAPGFDQIEEKAYPKRMYHFTSREAVEKFWLDLRLTCLSTPLGKIVEEYVKLWQYQDSWEAPKCLILLVIVKTKKA